MMNSLRPSLQPKLSCYNLIFASDRALDWLTSGLEAIERKCSHQISKLLIVLDQAHVLCWCERHELRCRHLLVNPLAGVRCA